MSGSLSAVNPRVAVVMPHFGAERHLGRAVRSLLAQEGVDLELHLVDDHSPGSGWMSAIEDVAADRRLITYRTSANVGPYRIKNALYKRVDAPVIAFQDADDVSGPGRLSGLLREMARTGADVVGSSYYEIDEAGNTLRQRRMVHNCNLWRRLGKSYLSLHPSTIVRRSVLDELGGFDGSRRFAADADFLLRAIRLFRVRNVREPLYYYRIRPGSLSNDPATGLRSTARQAYLSARRAQARTWDRIRDARARLRAMQAPANDVEFDLCPVRL
jgi:glycosyltransferase involved in cell wall biosynthesis